MSDYEIEIILAEELGPENELERLEQAAEAALRHEGVAGPAALSLLLTDDAQLQQLNRDFAGQDRPTDVLSFPAGGEGPGAAHYLGDVAISVPTARRQAEAAGHDLTAELLLLTVHGVLHLLGHDHVTADDKAAMWQAQAAILDEFGVDASRLPTANP